MHLLSGNNKLRKKQSIIAIILLAIAMILLSIFLYNNKSNKSEDKNKDTQDENPIVVTDNTQTIEKPITEETKSNKIPTEYLIDVPFAVQAPNANWDALHEDACEEASLIMLKYFLNKKIISNSSDIEPEIQAMIQYENINNYGSSITITELNTIAKNFLNLTTGRVVKDVTIEKLKEEISNNHPVIIPAAGKLLKNPNFQNGGPNYHMLVIKGYDETNFITNDPGTKNGENYKYPYQTLINSIHDWDKVNILNGEKSYLVFD